MSCLGCLSGVNIKEYRDCEQPAIWHIDPVDCRIGKPILTDIGPRKCSLPINMLSLIVKVFLHHGKVEKTIKDVWYHYHSRKKTPFGKNYSYGISPIHAIFHSFPIIFQIVLFIISLYTSYDACDASTIRFSAGVELLDHRQITTKVVYQWLKGKVNLISS